MIGSKRTVLWALLFGALTTALYGQFLHNPIVFDDLYFFMSDNNGHSAIEQFAYPVPWGLRAFPYATLAWTSQLLGFDLPPFRIENLLLHWLVVVTSGLFVLRLYLTVLPDSKRGENTSLSTSVLIVVALFAVHPIAVYAAGYLVQRTTVMAMLFSVLTLWTYLHGSANCRRFWLWVSVVLYFLATHSKEHVVMLPAVIVAMTILLHEDWRARVRMSWPVFAGYAAVALLTIAQIRGVLGHSYEINASEMLEGALPEHAHFYSILTQSWLFFKYGILWLLPNPAWLSVDMREPFAKGILSIYGVTFFAYLLYGWVVGRMLLKRGCIGLVGFALLFPWLMFATEFSTVRIQEIFVLYRSYIWAFGGVMLLPLVLMQFNVRLTILVSTLLATTFFMLSMERLVCFSHPILLWDDAEKLVKNRQSLPGVARIYYNRGTEWLKVDKYDSALADLKTATRLNPKFSAAFGNLGVVYVKTGQNDLAIQAYSQSIALDQELGVRPNYKNYSGRAGAYEANGDWMKAAVDYKVTCLLANKGCDKKTLAVPLLLK